MEQALSLNSIGNENVFGLMEMMPAKGRKEELWIEYYVC